MSESKFLISDEDADIYARGYAANLLEEKLNSRSFGPGKTAGLRRLVKDLRNPSLEFIKREPPPAECYCHLLLKNTICKVCKFKD